MTSKTGQKPAGCKVNEMLLLPQLIHSLGFISILLGPAGFQDGFGQTIGCICSGDPRLRSFCVYFAERACNPRHFLADLVRPCALQLAGGADDAACAQHVVRRVQDAARLHAATIEQRSSSTVAGVNTPPRAQGANTVQSAA